MNLQILEARLGHRYGKTTEHTFKPSLNMAYIFMEVHQDDHFVVNQRIQKSFIFLNLSRKSVVIHKI